MKSAVLLFASMVVLGTIVIPGVLLKRDFDKDSRAESVNRRVAQNYQNLPLRFEVNQGQSADEIKFLSRGQNYSLLLMEDSAMLRFRQPGRHLSMKFVGSNPRAERRGEAELATKSNYLIGNDETKWRTGIPNYSRVRYAGIYPGIDLIYYGNQKQLEYDFVIAPGADPRDIRIALAGDEAMRVDSRGDLLIDAPGGELRMQRPVIYQDIDGSRRYVDGNFVLGEPHEFGFHVAQYDTSKPLVVDPVLGYSSYLGGSSADAAEDIAVDASGNAYVVGRTLSTNFPTANPLQASHGANSGLADIFIAKMNAAGTALVYSTYLGGSGADAGTDIAVDASGNAYFTGTTGSSDFPTANPVQSTYAGNIDAFIAKLNAAGSALVYSTYLGGSQTSFFDSGQDAGHSIAVDSSGNAYVTGQTSSTNFPVASALQGAKAGGIDAFVAKLNAAGSALEYSTYLGGTNQDVGYAIALDSSNNAHVTGQTFSNNFPIGNAVQGTYVGGEAFVAKLNSAGSSLVYSTYLGGSSFEEGYAIAVDTSGNTYVAGRTGSTNFPTANAFQSAAGGGLSDAFLTKINAAGSAISYSTYLGGSGDDKVLGIAVDAGGNAYVTGATGSTNYPTADAIQQAHGGNDDAFVTKLNAAGSAPVYSTYLGGSGTDSGNGIAVDSSGNAYVAGSTGSSNFPTMNPFQSGSAGSDDAFIARIGSATSTSKKTGGQITSQD